MKITSKALFFEDADRSNGMVVFSGTGSVHGTDTDIQKIIDLPESTLCFKTADSDGNVVVEVRTPAGNFPLTLSDVENQETWVNTQAGADAALAMIDSWKKKSSVGTTNPKVYRALLNQTGENAPVGVEMPLNTFEGVTFGYTDTGSFKILSDGKFTNRKTIVKFSPSIGDGGYCLINHNYTSTSQIDFVVYNLTAGSPVNGSLINATIEILIYE